MEDSQDTGQAMTFCKKKRTNSYIIQGMIRIDKQDRVKLKRFFIAKGNNQPTKWKSFPVFPLLANQHSEYIKKLKILNAKKSPKNSVDKCANEIEQTVLRKSKNGQ